ncbi:Fes1-domain-containing protein [Guyanagaster necrorhizus]|uniref:Fes1-domain-containing protein n=1 Tax=Guyanagaster necrorhizus TaxID=856835 RepID=A0A9P7VU95_9AGAR|nr:Fes1-domain-containing protein [Guyanagaster necrorhizus MCA 3950]KAG7446738.1 Fes1-domain-containing protein [Guyanagaster necrorhizus MCA 3950]
MESLLRWSIEHSGPSVGAPQPRTDLDAGVIDLILGKSDAELMKEDLAVASDPHHSEDARVDALDHLEMLIEQIDNANNLEQLEMWQPLHSLLTSPDSTDVIVLQALWVIGTALQNNPAAQQTYLSSNPLPTLTAFLVPANSSPQIRSKALYALSGLLKHNAPAVKALASDAWLKLRAALADPEITVRRKAVFLLNTLLTPNETTVQAGPVHPNSHAPNLVDPSRAETSSVARRPMEEQGIFAAVVGALVDPLPYGEDGDVLEPDLDFEEKSIRLLWTYMVACDGVLDPEQKKKLAQWVASRTADRWAFSHDEFSLFEAALH